VRAPLAHGAGRWFDALGALGLARARSTYEGQVALEWNLAADGDVGEPYPFVLETAGPLAEADLRPMVREAVRQLNGGAAPGLVSARFHATMAEVAAAMIRHGAGVADADHRPVVLTGGCFQNALLAESVCRRLAGEFDVRLHGQVPPGDGGIALGQAVVADAVVRAGGAAGDGAVA
jgi:hydrogenase maturation protein HypF